MERIIISTETGEAKILINTRFYDYDTVLFAANDFSESCYVYLDGHKEDTLLVCLKPRSDDNSLEEVGLEFYNYLLGMMKHE